MVEPADILWLRQVATPNSFPVATTREQEDR